MSSDPRDMHPGWPTRDVLRRRLLDAGVPYLDADLYATLTQTGTRIDLRERVRSILGWA